MLICLNVSGRVRDAVRRVSSLGGKVLEDVHSLGRHGFRALLLDSEGNRIALNSEVAGYSESMAWPMAQGLTSNSSAFDRFVDLDAGGSRNQACASTVSPTENGAPSEPGFETT